jgi:hypothetical protein
VVAVVVMVVAIHKPHLVGTNYYHLVAVVDVAESSADSLCFFTQRISPITRKDTNDSERQQNWKFN